MLPKALKRAKCPAEALFDETFYGVGRFGPCDRRAVVENPVPSFLERDGEILILGEGVCGKAPELHQRLSPPRANSARDHRDAAKSCQSSALQILACDIFESLPARNDIDPVADFGIAGNRSNSGIFEPANKLANGVALKMRVGIERHNHRAARLS